jgi:hypothetical protein
MKYIAELKPAAAQPRLNASKVSGMRRPQPQFGSVLQETGGDRRFDFPR